MTCSSTTTSAPERRPGLRVLAAAALLAIAAAGPGLAAPGDDLVARARRALSQGEAIAAEVDLRRALDAGVPREAVAAYMGEVYLQREKPGAAREWLGAGAFTPATAAHGFRLLARLEQDEGNLVAAGKALDAAMAITPRDAALWVEVGRLRYVGGEHLQAIEAADRALELDPDEVRTLEFKGQLVRDSQGLVAALPWFERALKNHPRDMAVLGEYAATLGDLGQAKKMLGVTRQMLTIEPGNVHAYALQAILAARAGKTELARGLFARTKGELDNTPGGQLLEGLLEMQAGNHVLAAEALQKLVRAQPANARARLLLARAYALGGQHRLVIHDYAEAAARPDASPYLLALVARAYEADGRRDLAAPLLDRAALARRADLAPVAGSAIGAMLAAGEMETARAAADNAVARSPGSAFNQAIAGDVRLAAGDAAGALEHYRRVASVRVTQSLVLRMVAAALQSGRQGDAAALVEGVLASDPGDRVAMRMAAGDAAGSGDWRRARLLLERLRLTGGATDVALLTDLSLAQLRDGDAKAAEATARTAYDVQRASPAAALAWSTSLDALGHHAPAQALLAKSQAFAATR